VYLHGPRIKALTGLRFPHLEAVIFLQCSRSHAYIDGLPPQFGLAFATAPQVKDVVAVIAKQNAEFSTITRSGQILKEGSTLADCGVKENDVLVCMEDKV